LPGGTRCLAAGPACLPDGGLPPSTTDIAFQLTTRTIRQDTIWLRRFGQHKTRSRLRIAANSAQIHECFGPFTLTLVPHLQDQVLRIDIATLRFFGLPLPRRLTPRSQTVERIDAEGRIAFDIAASLPWGAPLIRYAGWCAPAPPPGN
jgi:hypothetical protein